MWGYSGTDHGVIGETAGDWSYKSGVYGKASQDHANGVTGWNTGSGVGVYGYSDSGRAGSFDGSVVIKGKGNTSATNSLVVGDSDDQSLLWVNDDGTVNINGEVFIVGRGTTGSTTSLLVTNDNLQMSLQVLDDGKVGVGALDSAASIHVCLSLTNPNADKVLAMCSSAAEYVPTVDTGAGYPEAGDLVSIVPAISDPYDDAHAPFAVAKASSPYDPNLVGFITDPDKGGDGTKLNDHYLPMAIYGYYPVKVTMQNGSIERGDPITSSTQPGYGMKAVEPGRIVGYALEDASVEGTIQVVAQVGDHLGDAPARIDQLEAELQALTGAHEGMIAQVTGLEARLTALEALLAGAVEGEVGP